VSRIGVIVLTISGNAVWYARQFEFARILQETCGAELAKETPDIARRSAGALVRRAASVLAPGKVNGPLNIQSLFDHEPDVIVVLASGVSDLRLLPEIRMPVGKPTVLCLFELWVKEMTEHRLLLTSSMRQFSHVAIGFDGSIEACRRLLREDVAFLGDGTDTLLQAAIRSRIHRPEGTQVLSYGRMHAAQFENLRQAWLAGRIRYRFDSISGWKSAVPLADHRRKLLEDLAAADFVVTNCAKFDEPALTSIQRPEFGPRFIKSAAAGAIPVGDFSPAYLLEDQGLRGLCVPLAETDRFVDRIVQLDPSERKAIQQHNMLCAVQRHDWAYRVDDLLRLLNEPSPEELLVRMAALGQQAHAIQTGMVSP
jgi:glycosyltransferase involved in cell wall biosynthesis